MPITYAKPGVTPGWQHLEVIDLETGEKLRYVVEVNTAEGWLIRDVLDAEGRFVLDPKGDRLATERVEGRFELRPTDDGAA